MSLRVVQSMIVLSFGLLVLSSCDLDEESAEVDVALTGAEVVESTPPCEVGEPAVVLADAPPFAAGDVVECLGRKTVRPFDGLVRDASGSRVAWVSEDKLAPLGRAR